MTFTPLVYVYVYNVLERIFILFKYFTTFTFWRWTVTQIARMQGLLLQLYVSICMYIIKCLRNVYNVTNEMSHLHLKKESVNDGRGRPQPSAESPGP